ncbi:MAG: cysteine--tRNA ligase [Firmicutes bacterium]|nr:cysteine--tRNA ligase [Bacillota bacterium]
MLKLYNTLSRKKEEFSPLGDNVTMYSCGPTVYNYAHIGNMRAYIFMDSVRRVLSYNGYKLKGMMNVTDVGHLVSDADEGEDKLVKAGREAGLTPLQIAEKYTGAFFADLAKLNINSPEIIEKASDHIDSMLDLVYNLLDKGYAYRTNDGIYFDIAKFPTYGALSRQKLDENIAGARVDVNSEKRHPADFALWKNAPKEHIMQWPSRFGQGYPGWHIECSAMGMKFLGESFDIHTGGVDHIPIHHENEIAQSEAATGKTAVKYWMHGEFMQVEGGKMSKSLGNVYTISQLGDMGYSPMDFRYFCLNTHYRKKLNFTFEALGGAKTAYDRLINLLLEHKAGGNKLDEGQKAAYKSEFLAAVNDDINIPMALGLLWTMLKSLFSRDIYDLALNFDRVFGLGFESAVVLKEAKRTEKARANDGCIDGGAGDPLPQGVSDLLEQRSLARKNKDFAQSDKLRGEIAALGFTVLDTKDGQTIKRG